MLFQRSGYFCLFFSLYIMCVCVFFCLYFADVCSSSMWSVPQGFGVLQSHASSLPDVALTGRAPSTSSKHFSSYNRWRSWAREHGLTVFPAFLFRFAIYLRHFMTEAKKASPPESAVNSITWFHQLGIFAGAQRFLTHQTSKKIRSLSQLFWESYLSGFYDEPLFRMSSAFLPSPLFRQ